MVYSEDGAGQAVVGEAVVTVIVTASTPYNCTLAYLFYVSIFYYIYTSLFAKTAATTNKKQKENKR